MCLYGCVCVSDCICKYGFVYAVVYVGECVCLLIAEWECLCKCICGCINFEGWVFVYVC